MTLNLPLARGSFDAMPALRSDIDPRTLAGAVVNIVDQQGNLALVSGGDSLFSIDEGAAGAVLRDALDVYLLGRTGDGAVHVVAVVEVDGGADGEQVDGEWPEEWSDGVGGDGHVRWESLRTCGHELGDDEAALATASVALWNWHRVARFCVRCGSAVEPAEAGWATRCTGCGNLDYPRQDPAVIMAVLDSRDRVLMAHNRMWPRGRWSVLAGFVEAGEAPERTVQREIMEETGLRVGDVEYLGAQPWPFPRSLMLGYFARLAEDGEPVPDGVELEEARFFSRSDLAAAIASGEVTAPPPSTIARSLLDRWYGEGADEVMGDGSR